MDASSWESNQKFVLEALSRLEKSVGTLAVQIENARNELYMDQRSAHDRVKAEVRASTAETARVCNDIEASIQDLHITVTRIETAYELDKGKIAGKSGAISAVVSGLINGVVLAYNMSKNGWK